MSWRDQTACTGMDTTVFFPVSVHDDPGPARRVCAECPVREACLLDAYETEQHRNRFGIRGGLTATERDAQAHLHPHRAGRPVRAECGTNAGYYRHHRRHEPTCQDCRDAHAAAVARRALERSA